MYESNAAQPFPFNARPAPPPPSQSGPYEKEPFPVTLTGHIAREFVPVRYNF